MERVFWRLSHFSLASLRRPFASSPNLLASSSSLISEARLGSDLSPLAVLIGTAFAPPCRTATANEPNAIVASVSASNLAIPTVAQAHRRYTVQEVPPPS